MGIIEKETDLELVKSVSGSQCIVGKGLYNVLPAFRSGRILVAHVDFDPMPRICEAG